MKFDLAIIGGGPAGYNVAERAAHNGLQTVLFEKKSLGGVCLNEGCIPTKTMLYSAKLYDSAKTASKYGILDIEKPGFDLKKIVQRKDRTVKKLIGGVKMKMQASGVTVVENEAVIQGEEGDLIKIKAGEELYEVSYVIIATGSETFVPPIKGLSNVDFWTSKTALEVKELPASLAVIGGGVIGMEFAALFNSFGVKVSVVEMLPEILGNMDKELSAMLRKDYEKRGIDFHIGTKVVEVTANSVLVEKDGESKSIEAEKVLVSTGRVANIKGIGLESLNIELLRNGIKVNEYMQTSHPKVYAAGDVTGTYMLAHTASRESDVALNHIVGVEDKMSYKANPSVVYTNPEIASVGKTEEELKANGQEYLVFKLPMAYSGRFMAENENMNGVCKLVTDMNETIIGCHMLGNPVSEIIATATMAIEENYSIEEFKKIIFPHPTVAEIIHEVLFV